MEGEAQRHFEISIDSLSFSVHFFLARSFVPKPNPYSSSGLEITLKRTIHVALNSYQNIIFDLKCPKAHVFFASETVQDHNRMDILTYEDGEISLQLIISIVSTDFFVLIVQYKSRYIHKHKLKLVQNNFIIRTQRHGLFTFA